MSTPVSRAIAMAEDAFEAGEFEDMLRLCDEALRAAPDDLDALELKGTAQAELGDWDGADATFAKLLVKDPKSASFLLAAADVKVRLPGDDRDRLEAGLALLDRAWPLVRDDEVLLAEAQLLRGVALNQLGECEDALDCFAEVLELDPENVEARLERGLANFELGRFEPARKDFEAVLREFPDEAQAHHHLGLLAERAGRPAEAHFRRAQKLAPEEYPPPVELTQEAFTAAVSDAIDSLPEQTRPHLANVVISVEPLPSDEDVREGLAPTVLGVFHGTPVDERSPVDALAHDTARIVLFQKNLQRFARSRDELLEQIRVTVLHEVGHLMGLNEEELADRGLD